MTINMQSISPKSEYQNEIAPKFKILSTILIISYIVGALGLAWEQSRSLFLQLTPFFLLFNALLVFNTEFIARNITYWLWLIPAALISFYLEAYGVATGSVFGVYSYGEVLGLKVAEVPVIIGLNWVMVIWGAYAFASYLTNDKIAKAFITGAACVVFDYFLEPVAIALGFWNWQEVKVPAQNYLAWFAISFVLGLLAHYLKLKNNTNIVPLQLLLQFLLFLSLNIFI